MILRTGTNTLARGLTLIEILVSVAILASAVVLIMQALMRGSYTLQVAENRLRAYVFSVAKLADLELAMAADHHVKPNGQFRVGRDLFEWSLETTPSLDDPQLSLMTLTVGWRGSGPGRTAQVSMLRRMTQEGS